jgi:hypothetical protein
MAPLQFIIFSLDSSLMLPLCNVVPVTSPSSSMVQPCTFLQVKSAIAITTIQIVIALKSISHMCSPQAPSVWRVSRLPSFPSSPSSPCQSTAIWNRGTSQIQEHPYDPSSDAWPWWLSLWAWSCVHCQQQRQKECKWPKYLVYWDEFHPRMWSCGLHLGPQA